MPSDTNWTSRGEEFFRESLPRIRRTPPWAQKWGVSLLIILMLIAAYRVTVGLLQNPQARTMQTMMHPSGLTGPVAVTAQPAVRRDLAEAATYPATVAADEEVPIYARVEGWVLSIGPREGDFVNAGEVLARLDTSQLAPEVEQHRLDVAAARGTYDDSEAGIAQAKANLADAQAKQSYWAGEFKRDQILYQHGVIPAREYDQAQQAYASAQAGVSAAQGRIAAQQAGAQAAAAQVGAQQAALTQMEATLGYATVVAPQSGTVTARLVDPGTLVKPGQPLLKIARMDDVRVRVQVAQEDAMAVHVGTPAVLRFEGVSEPARAVVTRVFPADTEPTRTTTVEILTPNPAHRIKLGMYASVTLDLAVHRNVVVVPRSAVLPGEGGGQPTAFVVNGTSAQARPVTTGLAQSDSVEIVRGIKPGEMVITNGNRGLVDGQAVTVTNF